MSQTPYLDRQLAAQKTRLKVARARLHESPTPISTVVTIRGLEDDIRRTEALDDENRALGDALLALLD